MKRFIFFVIFFLILFVIFSHAEENSIKIGIVNNDPAETITKHSIIANYLAEKLSGYGISKGQIIVALNNDEMINFINNKKVDIFIDTVFSMLIIKEKSKIDIILRRWKKGVSQYKTLFIAKKDSSINSLKDLKGKKIGFEDPGSTSSRWIPQAMLMQMRYTLKELKNPNEPISKKEIGYVFTQASENTPLWIIQGKIDVGALSSDDYKDIPEQLKNKLKIIGESFYVPRQLLSVRSDLDKKLIDEIKKVLLEMDKTPGGKDVLKKWEKTAKLDEINNDIEKSIREAKKLIKYIKSE